MTPQPPSSTRESGALTRRTWLLALAVAVTACLLRVAYADRRGLWLDEYFTLDAATMGLHEMIDNRLGAGHSPLYFFYARLGPLLGETERALRLTSALAAGAAVLTMTGLMGALRLGRFLPWLWFLAVVEPYWIAIGMEYRYTMPLLALAAGVAWVAVLYAERPSLKRAVALTLAIGLLLWTHASTPFFVIGLLVFQAWDGLYSGVGQAAGQRLREAARRIAPVLAGLALGAAFFMLIRNNEANPDSEFAALKDLFKDLVAVVFGDHRLWFRHFDWDHRNAFFNLEAAVLAGSAVLSWIELKRLRNARAARLLASTMLAIPLLMFTFCVLVKNFQGPVRYLATFTIPAVICLAVAAHAPGQSAWLRWTFRAALLLILAFQSSAMTLDRGDRHRDALNWVIQNHQGKDPVLVSVTTMNNLALRFKGFDPDGVTFGSFERTDPLPRIEERIRQKLQKEFPKARRLLFLRYHSRAKVVEAIESLTKKGFFAGYRSFKIGKLVVGSAVLNKTELPWLNALPEPPQEWGPDQIAD